MSLQQSAKKLWAEAVWSLALTGTAAALVMLIFEKRTMFTHWIPVFAKTLGRLLSSVPSTIMFLLGIVLTEIVVVFFLVLPLAYLVKKVWIPLGGERLRTPPRLTPEGTLVEDCVCLATASYGNPGPEVAHYRYVDRFWVEGGVFGLIKIYENKAFVAFRGTSEIGNWFLTNAQAHTVCADELFGDGAKGGVHHGFAKAFADLWRAEPLGSLTPAENYKITRWFWPVAMVFSATPMIFVADLRPTLLHGLSWWLTALNVLFSLCLIQLIFASGAFESWFGRATKLVVGPALSGSIPTDVEEVVFTGHSLGGAVAALAFADYCMKNEHNGEKPPARLVTFGAPRFGNDEFLDWFTKTHEKKHTFVADVGDPIPYLPPSDKFIALATHGISWLSALLISLYVVAWVPYAICYRVRCGTKWEGLIRWRGKEAAWSIEKHGSYKTLSPNECMEVPKQ